MGSSPSNPARDDDERRKTRSSKPDQSVPSDRINHGVNTHGETARGETAYGETDLTLGDDSSFEDVDGQPAAMIGKYQLLDVLGSGGMGAVHLGFDPLIERQVAIKILDDQVAANETALQRFLGEARAVGRLNHPNVISVYDIGEDSGRHFIVMELATGGSVRTMLHENKRLSLEQACRIVIEAARGLAAAHAVGLIHRDVKPDNLMLGAGDVIKVVDFGVAKDLDRRADFAMTGEGQMLGTPYYMSPEQIEGDAFDSRTDIYSLGATFYHLLTGKAPFDADSLPKLFVAHGTADRPDPREVNADLPSECAAVIAKALAIQASDRFRSMEEFAAELENLLQHARSADDDAAPIKTPRILILEPSKLRSKVTSDVFRKSGCQDLVCATAADEAIKFAASQTFDVAIASRQLRGSSGEQVLRNIRELYADVMCILDSSDPPEEILAQARLSGTVAYLQKQENPEELLRAIHVASQCSIPQREFVRHGNRLGIDIVSKDGAMPSEIADWINQNDNLEVSMRSYNDTGAMHRDLVVWLIAASSQTDFPAWLSGSTAGDLMQQSATLGIVEKDDEVLRLRGVRRRGFIALCDCTLDRNRWDRIVNIV